MKNLFKPSNSISRDEFFFPIEQYFDKFFQDFFHEPNVTTTIGGYPKMDIFEEGSRWIIKMALPGVKSEDVTVSILPPSPESGIRNKLLQISGKMSEEHQSEEGSTYYVKELKKSAFQRRVQLPDWLSNLDNDEPDTSFKDGILKLSWEKPLEKKKFAEVKPKLITVKQD